MTANSAPPRSEFDQAALDAVLIDAAQWRLHRKLARHWLHGFRGSLNAMSLNIVLLENAAAQPGSTNERTWQTFRSQLRELDSGLTRLLEDAALDDAMPDHTNVGAALSGAAALIEPLLKRRQVRVETHGTEAAALAQIEGAILHAVLLAVIGDVIDRVAAGSTMRLEVDEISSDRLRIDLAYGRMAADNAPDSPVLEAARRLLERHGGQIDSTQAGDVATVRLQLPHGAPAAS
jgi:hypothetical protein